MNYNTQSLSYSVQYSIIHAALFGNIPALANFYHSGINLNEIYDYDGDGLLQLAIITRQPDVFNTLLDYNLDVNFKSPYSSNTPINTAAIYGATEYITPLLERGADINTVDFVGFTPLLNTLWFEEYPTANYILSINETDVNIPSDYALTPLLLAYFDNQWDIVNTIVQHPSYDVTFNYILVSNKWGVNELALYLEDSGYKGDIEFIEAFEALKLLGLRYDFNAGFAFANSDKYNFTFKFEGAINEIGLKGFFEGYSTYLESMVSQANLPAWGAQMHTSVYNALSFSEQAPSPPDYLQRYLDGKPVLVQSGWDGHSIVFVLHDNRLYRCNRGDLADKGIEEFIIHKPEGITADLIDFMLDASGEADYLQYEIINVLGLEKINAIEMKMQTAGNCVWTSLEAGLEALMLTSLLHQGLDNDIAHFLAKENYEHWKHYDLDYGLANCIYHKDVFIEQGLYDNILLRILEENHNAHDPYQVERGVLILDELTRPEHVEIFNENIGQLVNQYDIMSFENTQYMKSYQTDVSFTDWLWNASGLSPWWHLSNHDYQQAKDYYEFLLACENFEVDDNHFVLELSDIFTQINTNDILLNTLEPSYETAKEAIDYIQLPLNNFTDNLFEQQTIEI